MPLPQRKWLNHSTPAGVRDAVFFITVCCQERGHNQLCWPEISAPLLDAARHYHEHLRWHVWLWLLMPDHVHGLVGVSRYELLAKLMAAWKRHTAKQTGIKWQRGFFDHRLRNDEGFAEKAAYVRQNPVRARLAARAEDWPFVWCSTDADASERRPYPPGKDL
jgi:REP element-mobilizing transposase RayT